MKRSTKQTAKAMKILQKKYHLTAREIAQSFGYSLYWTRALIRKAA